MMLMRSLPLIFSAIIFSAAAMAQDATTVVSPADSLVPPPLSAAAPTNALNIGPATAIAPAISPVPKSDPTAVANLPPQPTDFVPATEEVTPIEQAMLDQIDFLKPAVDIPTMPSLFFSTWEHDLLVDARRGLNTRPPDDDDQVESTVATGPRDVGLSGIVYASSKDWVIWLNNMRISPGRIPNEIMDLKVYKNHVDLEWYDSSTNQIFPIRLRPHQRFNLDARIFLPGNI